MTLSGFGNTIEEPKADEALLRRQTVRVCRDKPTRTAEEKRAERYLHPDHNRPAYQNGEGHPASEYYSSYGYGCAPGVMAALLAYWVYAYSAPSIL